MLPSVPKKLKIGGDARATDSPALSSCSSGDMEGASQGSPAGEFIVHVLLFFFPKVRA